MNVGARLKRKLGPLPVWAWAALAFVGLYYYRNRGQAAAAAATSTDTGLQPAQPLTPGNTSPTTSDMATGSGVDTTGQTTAGELFPDSKLAQAVHNIIDQLNAAAASAGVAGATVPVGADGASPTGVRTGATAGQWPLGKGKRLGPPGRARGGAKGRILRPRRSGARHPVHPARTAPSQQRRRAPALRQPPRSRTTGATPLRARYGGRYGGRG